MELKRLSSTASPSHRHETAHIGQPTCASHDRVELGGARALAEASVAGHRTMRELQSRWTPRPASPAGLKVADHLCEPAEVRGAKDGIYAGHRPAEFEAALQNNGQVIESFKPETPVAGTEVHRYKMNTKTSQGHFDGGLSARQFTKTVFDEQFMSRERLGRLADLVFEHAPQAQNSYVQLGNDFVFAVRDGKGAPRTFGFEPSSPGVGRPVVKRPVSDLQPFTSPEMQTSTRWSRAAGWAGKGLAGLGVLGGGWQTWNGVEALARAQTGRQALDGAADLTGGIANTVSGAGALAGAEALATRCGALGAVLDGGRDLVQGLTADHVNAQRAGVGLLKTTAGIAMAMPGGALVGGALYAGTLLYEHREAVGEAIDHAWTAVSEWVA